MVYFGKCQERHYWVLFKNGERAVTQSSTEKAQSSTERGHQDILKIYKRNQPEQIINVISSKTEPESAVDTAVLREGLKEINSLEECRRHDSFLGKRRVNKKSPVGTTV